MNLMTAVILLHLEQLKVVMYYSAHTTACVSPLRLPLLKE